MMRYQKIVEAWQKCRRHVLNSQQYFCSSGQKFGAVNKTAKALKVGQSTIARIVRRGEVRISRRGYVHQVRDKFEKVKDLEKKLIRETIYNFYKNKTAPTIDALSEKMKEISTGTHYKLLYGRTTLPFPKKNWLQI